MAVTVGDIVRVAFRQTYGVDDIVNVVHLTVGAVPGMGGDALFLSDIADFAADLWQGLAPLLATDLEPVDIACYNITDDNPVGVTDFGSYAGGAASGDALPAAACAMVLMPTGKKRTIGRMYLSPFTEASQSGGKWGAGVISDIEDFVDFMLAPQSGTNGYEFQVGIYSRSDGILRFPATRRVAPVIAYQLRRKPGRGS